MIDDRQGKPLPLSLVMEAAERYELAQEIDLLLLEQAGACLKRAEGAGKQEAVIAYCGFPEPPCGMGNTSKSWCARWKRCRG